MKYSDMEIEVLCTLAQKGDRLAEDELVRQCRKMVRACARPLFLMGGDQEDLMQEGMLGLLKAIREFDIDKGYRFRTFAENCVRNQMFSAIRSAAGKHHTPLNDSVPIDTTLLEMPGTYETPNPEEVYISQEIMQEKLERLRSLLSDFECRVLGLYLSGMSITEIARAVNRPVKSVDNAVQRVRHKSASDQEG